MRQEDLIWLAGWLEGEGSFLHGPPSDPNRPRISAQCTDEDVCQRGADLCGVTICSCKTYADNHKPTWRMTLTGRRARELMLELLPYMGKRRSEQIRSALASWSVEYKPRTSIPKDVILEVRSLGSSIPAKELAKRFDISTDQVKSIKRGATGAWAVAD